MLNYALLKRKPVMHRRSNGLSMTRVKDHSCGATTGEGSKHGCLADINGWHLELLEHKLGQLEPQIFVVNGSLRENERGVPRVHHQLLYQPLPQNIFQVVKVYYSGLIQNELLTNAWLRQQGLNVHAVTFEVEFGTANHDFP